MEEMTVVMFQLLCRHRGSGARVHAGVAGKLSVNAALRVQLDNALVDVHKVREGRGEGVMYG
jgi:hypothetical protein